MIGRVHNGNSGFNMQNKTCLALQSNCRKGSGTSQHIFVLFSLSRLLLSGMSGVFSANINIHSSQNITSCPYYNVKLS